MGGWLNGWLSRKVIGFQSISLLLDSKLDDDNNDDNDVIMMFSY